MLKDHNAVMPVRLEPADPRSQVKRSTTAIDIAKLTVRCHAKQNLVGTFILHSEFDMISMIILKSGLCCDMKIYHRNYYNMYSLIFQN